MSVTKKDVILFPFSGGTREIAAMMVESLDTRVVGFIDDDMLLWGKHWFGFPVLGSVEKIGDYPHAFVMVIPGNPETFQRRKRIIKKLKIPALRYYIFIAPTCVISGIMNIGYNTVIYPGVVIGENVVIGNHCVILPNTVISHDTVVGDYTMIGANVTIAGGVKVAENCYIGSGACIHQNKVIGEKTMIGMGAIVLHDTLPYSKIVGNPGRELT